MGLCGYWHWGATVYSPFSDHYCSSWLKTTFRLVKLPHPLPPPPTTTTRTRTCDPASTHPPTQTPLHTLPPPCQDEVPELHALFHNLDTDKSGRLSPQEFREGLQRLGTVVSEVGRGGVDVGVGGCVGWGGVPRVGGCVGGETCQGWLAGGWGMMKEGPGGLQGMRTAGVPSGC